MENRTTILIKSRRSSQDEKRQSQQSCDSVINDLSPAESKFYSAFIQNWEIFNAFIYSYQIIQPHRLFGAKFIIYRIKVITDHLCYTIDKRYRDFLSLYSKVSAYYTPKIQFPKKTHLKSKICPLLTENRRKLFDDFMTELFSMRNSNKSVIAQFITFLDIKGHYNKKQLDQSIFLKSNLSQKFRTGPNLFPHMLKHQLVKIQALPNQSLRHLNKIQNLLLNSTRGQVKNQDLRILLLGVNKLQGLIQLGCSSSNQVVALSFLKTIKKFMNSEICPYSQVFKKILEIAPARLFLLQHQQILENEQFKFSYFSFVDNYMKIRSNAQNQPSFQILIRQVLRPNVIIDFVEWKTGRRNVQNQIRRKTQLLQIPSVTMQNNQLKSSSQIQDNQKQINHYQVFDQMIKNVRNGTHIQTFKQIVSEGDWFSQIDSRLRAIHYSITTNKSLKQIEQILRKWNHNELISTSYQAQKLTNICKLFIKTPNGQQRVFHLLQQIKRKNTFSCEQNCENTQQDETEQLQITYLPPKKVNNINSFFYLAKIVPVSKKTFKIDLLYYFHTKRVYKIFAQQFKNQENIMWKNLVNTFGQKQQNKLHNSNLTTKTSSTDQIKQCLY